MSKTRGKRPGLRARSKNARSTAKVAKVTKVLAVIQAAPRIDMDEREELYTLRALAKVSMRFHGVEAGAPNEGQRVLVRLRDGTFRFGMVLAGRFANYEYHAEEFVTMAHPERITHWMVVIDPVPRAPEQTIDEAILAAAQAPDRAEDVYA